jgi:hypothetical protein
MLWVFFGLACTELLVVHLVLVLRWPRAAWPLSGLTLLSILWLVGWIRSWPRLPHRLQDGVLRLHFGSLRHIDVPLGQIARARGVADGDLRAPDVLNLVPIAHPNRILDLAEPLAGSKPIRHIAIRLDDVAGFDAALGDAGIAVA